MDRIATGNAGAVIPVETAAALDALAQRHRAASGIGMQLLGLVGGHAENLLERLPDAAKDRLEVATERALRVSLDAAARSRGGRLPDGAGWQNTALTTALGAVGGFGGLPTALAELPLTTTVLLRAIQAIAEAHGYDPASPEIRADCLQVFAAAGPLAADDGAELGFLAARVALTGPVVHGLIARVAPRLSLVLGQKLAAQTIPVIGAVAGATINHSFTRYYQEMAHLQFGLKRLSDDSGIAHAVLLADLRQRLGPRPRLRG